MLRTALLLVGLLGSQRRQALLQAECLARDLWRTNAELARVNQEQARAAKAALTVALVSAGSRGYRLGPPANGGGEPLADR